MSCPRWSDVGECHSWSWSLMSAVRMDLSLVSMYVSVFVMSASELSWSGLLLSLGGMYRLKMFSVFEGDRCSLTCWSSVMRWLMLLGIAIAVKDICFDVCH